MSTMHEITEQLRASNFEHVRAVIEPDDVMVLLAFLEKQGFLSAEGIAALEAEANENSGTYYAFLQSKGLEIDKAPNVSGVDDEHAAHRAEYVRWLATDEGKKAVEKEAAGKAAAGKADADAKAKADADAEKAAAKAEKDTKK